MPSDGDPEVGGDRLTALEAERRHAAARGAAVPGTPITHARRVTTGRSTDTVWWVAGLGWAAVVKRGAQPGTELDWDHAARELAAYRSGLLVGLPSGIRAPRCLAIVEHDDETASLWLEGIEGPTASHWPLQWYRVAARALGSTQGAFVADVPLPQHPWLNRGSLRDYVRQHPCPDDASAVAALRCDDRLLEALEQLPSTLCHFDLHPRNVLVGDGEVVVIDWASVGLGVIGEDVSTLIASALLDGHVPPGGLRELFHEVVGGYSEGLGARGLDVDDAELARAVGGLLVVRLGWVIARRLQDPGGDSDRRAGAAALAVLLEELADAARAAPSRPVVAPPGSYGAGR